MAPNPILETYFFRVRKNVVCKKVIFYASYICSMKRHKFWPARFRGKSLKSCQRDPYRNGCRHLAENFLGKPQIFLHPIHGQRRALRSCESGFLKLRSVRDNGAKPYIRNPFFPSYEKRCLQIFDILGELMCPTKWHKLRQATDFLSVTKKLKHTSYQNVWRHQAENFQRQPPVFLQRLCSPHQAL